MTTMSSNPEPDEFYEGPDQWAARYDLSRPMVYKLMAQGVPSIKIGRARRIPVYAAHAWLMERNQQ